MNYDALEAEYEHLKRKKDLTDDEKVELCVLRQVFGEQSLSFEAYQKAELKREKQTQWSKSRKW